MAIDLSGYVEVKDRIAQFKEEYPNGRLTSEIVETGYAGFITVKAYAWRTPDDPCPGVGLAWEPVPGRTPYTKDSELQNAETSAWGRALIAALIADATQGVASANEVRNRSDVPPPTSEPGTGSPTSGGGLDSSYQCPSCHAPVINNLPEYFKDSKKPAWKCADRTCQGGGKKKGGGNWPWATWDANFFRTDEFEDTEGTPIREDYEPATFDYPPGQEPF